MLRRLPVRERCMMALEDKIKSIQGGLEFNYTVKSVSRTRALPDRSDDPPEIFIIQTEAKHQTRNNYQDIDTLSLQIWFIIDDNDTDSPDTQYNLFIGDLQHLFQCYTIIDTTHPEGRIIDVETQGDRPFYTEIHESKIVGKMDIELAYSRMKDNPYKWDVEDQEFLVEE